MNTQAFVGIFQMFVVLIIFGISNLLCMNSPLYSEYRNKYVSRVYSTIFAIYVTTLCILYLIRGDVDNLLYIAINISTVSYCLFDICVIFNFDEVYDDTPISIIIHHVMLAFATLLTPVNYAPQFCIGMMSELTNIPLNISWIILKKIDLYNDKLDENYMTRDKTLAVRKKVIKLRSYGVVTGVATFFGFVFLRVINFAYLLAFCLNHNLRVLAGAVAVLLTMNIVWTVKIYRKCAAHIVSEIKR